MFLRASLSATSALVGVLLCATLFAQAPMTGVYPTSIVPQQTTQPIQQTSPQAVSESAASLQAQQQHPLAPAIAMAERVKQNIDNSVRDYSATIEKCEQIDGKLGEPEFAFIKVRNKPFSVYMSFLAPEKLKGQECMFIEGQNEDKMYAHAPPGTIRYKFGTVKIAPTSAIAMQGQRYPITEMGILNLTTKLIDVGKHDMQYGECDVKFIENAKVNGTVCTVTQVTHPVPRRNFLFHMARIFVDNQLQVPIRYEAYDWPTQPGGKPVLLEEYTYMNLKLNQGFTDADFDVHNPNYNFNVK
jgi:Protein of unknown function (DUF1571)